MRRKSKLLAESNGRGEEALLDYRLFYSVPEIVLSYENADILAVGTCFVGLPRTRYFNPEALVDDPSGIVITDSVEAAMSRISRWAGKGLAERRPDVPQICLSHRGCNVIKYLNGIYCVPQRIGPVDFVLTNPLDHEEIFVVMSEQAARTEIDRILGPKNATSPVP